LSLELHDDPETMLMDSKNRVLSIALIHEMGYRVENLSEIKLRDYLSDLVRLLVDSYDREEDVKLILELQNITADLDTAMNIGMIVNEIMMMTLKEISKDKETHSKTMYRISLSEHADGNILSVSLNRSDLSQKAASPEGLNILLINTLTQKIEAEFRVLRGESSEYRLVF
jgi:two-component sensor histidine kinase